MDRKNIKGEDFIGLLLKGKSRKTVTKWQYCLFFLYGIVFALPFTYNTVFTVFLVDSVPHKCDISKIIINKEEDGNLNFTTEGSCSVRDLLTNDTKSCSKLSNKYLFDEDFGYDSTIVTDFNLVCENSILTEVFLSASTFGGIFGALFINRLSDILGRKKLLTGVLFVGFVRCMGTALAPSFMFLTVWEALLNTATFGLPTTIMILVLEIFPKEMRTFAGTAIEFFWMAGYFLVALIAYYLRNWRHLVCIDGAFQLFCAAVIHFVTPESIEWLLANGRLKEAEDIITDASKFNGDKKIIDRDDFNVLYAANEIQEEGQVASKITIFGIFRHKIGRKYVIYSVLLWCINMLVYHGLNLTVTQLSGNRYLNFTLFALAELPAFIAMYYILPIFGRRIPCCIFHAIAGIFLILTIIPGLGYVTYGSWLTILLNFVGKFGITASFSIIYMHTPEIFPTNVRNFSLGMCMCFSRLVSLITPFVRPLDRKMPWLIRLLFGVISILGALLSLALPETLGRELPKTLDELNDWDIRGPKYDKNKSKTDE